MGGTISANAGTDQVIAGGEVLSEYAERVEPRLRLELCGEVEKVACDVIEAASRGGRGLGARSTRRPRGDARRLPAATTP